MTIGQIDKILSGEGLGVFEHLYSEDLTDFGYIDKNMKICSLQKCLLFIIKLRVTVVKQITYCILFMTIKRKLTSIQNDFLSIDPQFGTFLVAHAVPKCRF